MTTPIFLPWVRRGLARASSQVDLLGGTLPAATEVRAEVELVDSGGASITATHTVPLVGPGDVRGIDTSQIIRYEPAPGSADAETNSLAFVEVLAPDLPWLLTPAAPTSNGALRPWLVLVVVEEGAGVTYESDGAGLAGTLTIEADQVTTELWDLDDSYAWTHVQSSVPPDAVAADVEAGRGTVIARILCPRKLQTSRRYRAALVPAFEAGRAAGLGVAVPQGDTGPAWEVDAPERVELPVYATWTFATSDVPGDFESLASRVQPDTNGGRIGVHACRLDVGGLLPEPDPELGLGFEYAGAMIDPGLRPLGIPAVTKEWLEPQIRRAIERGTDRATVRKLPTDYLPERDDPVLAPPMYGRWPARRASLPADGWLERVNLEVGERVAAGLGAEIVRRNQEAFLASAWDQTGALRQAAVEASRSRLAAEVADRHHARLAELDDSSLLFAIGTAKAFIAQGNGSVQSVLADSRVVPEALVSAAFFRATGRGSVVSRRVGGTVTGKALPSSVGDTFLAGYGATVPAQLGAVTTFTASFVPDGAILGGIAATPVPRQPIPSRPRAGQRASSRKSAKEVERAASTQAGAGGPALSATVMMTAGWISGALGTSIATSAGGLVMTVPRGSGAASEAAGVVRATMPSVSVAAGFAQRSRGLGVEVGPSVPTRFVVGPWFPDGLSPKLIEISPELLVPGLGDFTMDRVRLLALNESFIASLLIGANHEWSREALWREFPADLAATAFASLFDRPGNPAAPGPDTDLNTELHNAGLGASLASLIGGSGTSTIIVLRAELVRRYPGLIVTLLEPDGGELPISTAGRIDPDHNLAPIFAGRIDPATLYAGYGVDPDQVLAEGWWVNLEQPATGPRFGFDAGRAGGGEAGHPPDHWSDLTWGDLRAADPGLTQVRFSNLGWEGETRDGLTWGRNAAHQAAIAYQRPYRMIFPAAALIGGLS